MTDQPFRIGDIVHDRDVKRPNDAIVVNIPGVPANEWDVPPIRKTVAEDNPDYPEDAETVVLVYKGRLRRSEIDWDPTDNAGEPLSLTRINDSDISPYSFPAPRLTLIEKADLDDDDEETADETSPDSDTTDMTESTATDNADSDSETPADETDEPADASDETDESPPQSDAPPEPSPALVDLKRHLEDHGLTVELADDNETLIVSKLGQDYRIHADGEVVGDGAFRSRLATTVANAECA